MKTMMTILLLSSLTLNIFLMHRQTDLEYALGRKILECMQLSADLLDERNKGESI